MSAPEDKHLQDSYNATMSDMRTELTSPQKVYSYIIHMPVISHIGALIGGVLLRPRSLVIGATFAIITTMATYLIARLHGYTPSGIEAPVGFLLGWACGIIYDLIHYILNKK